MIPVFRTQFNEAIQPALTQSGPTWAFHGAKGVEVLDLNAICSMAFSDPGFTALSKKIGPPIGLSELSGLDGAYAHETVDGHDGKQERILILLLTPDEKRRLTLRNLRPKEFHTLHDRYGVFFEIHDDFYDSESGVALQPKG